MSVEVVTFFNNKGGVGKTSLVFHLAWMLSELGHRVVTIDLDPQANLTSAFLSEEDLEVIWDSPASVNTNATVYQCIRPLTEMGDLLAPQTQRINPRLHLVPGDLALSGFEDALSQQWPTALDANPLRAFRLLTAFWHIAQTAAQQNSADIVLADVGPNLGAINRSALIGTDHVVVPLAADLFSLQGLRNLGPTLQQWRKGWKQRVDNWAHPALALPAGRMAPLGYVLMQHSERLSRPVKAYEKWADRIPSTYRDHIDPSDDPLGIGIEPGLPHCLARLKHYRSLIPMAQEARKPIFKLTPADGAIGSHAYAVRDAYADFKRLAEAIMRAIEARRGAAA
jgi:chromosome partitioning protein